MMRDLGVLASPSLMEIWKKLKKIVLGIRRIAMREIAAGYAKRFALIFWTSNEWSKIRYETIDFLTKIASYFFILCVLLAFPLT